MARKKNRSNLEAARSRMYHELVFECAEHLFAEQGFDESSMRDIAAEAGISLRTLYSAYPGKQDIFTDILRTRGGEFTKRVQDAVGPNGDVLERLRSGVTACTEFLLEHQDFFQILLRDGRGWGIDPNDDSRSENWGEGMGFTAALVREGIEEGVFYEGDPDLAAASISALLQAQLAGRMSRQSDASTQAVSEAIFTQICRFLCRPDSDAYPDLRVA
jgi:AcrR family transcriptional regulator